MPKRYKIRYVTVKGNVHVSDDRMQNTKLAWTFLSNEE